MFGICRTQGGMHAELLWTNPNQETIQTFPEQTVTLLKSYKNYNYIFMDVYTDTSNSEENVKTILMCDLSTFKILSDGTYVCPSIYGFLSPNYTYMNRPFYPISDTEIHFKNAMRSSSESLLAVYCVPLHIYGIKGKIGGA